MLETLVANSSKKCALSVSIDLVMQTGINYILDKPITDIDKFGLAFSCAESVFEVDNAVLNIMTSAGFSCVSDGFTDNGKFRDGFDGKECAKGAVLSVTFDLLLKGAGNLYQYLRNLSKKEVATFAVKVTKEIKEAYPSGIPSTNGGIQFNCGLAISQFFNAPFQLCNEAKICDMAWFVLKKASGDNFVPTGAQIKELIDAGVDGVDIDPAIANKIADAIGDGNTQIKELFESGYYHILRDELGDGDKLGKMFEDFVENDNYAFLELIRSNSSFIKIWKTLLDLPDKKDWIRKNIDILKKFDEIPIEKQIRLKQIYENLALPSDIKLPLPKSVTREANGKEVKINFNKYGFPEFQDNITPLTNSSGEKISTVYNGSWNKGNRGQDLRDASKWAMENLPSDKVRRYKTPKGRTSYEKIEIKDDAGNWVTQTWHHHENGIDLIPVPSDIHNPISHSGGYAITNGEPDLKGIFEYGPSFNK